MRATKIKPTKTPKAAIPPKNPRPTIITSLFELPNREKKNKTITEYLKLGKFILDLDENLILYTNTQAIKDYVLNQRKGKQTKIHLVNLQSLYYFKYIDYMSKCEYKILNINRKKDTGEYIALTNNKFEFIREVALTNPFNSSKIIWLDFGVAHVAKNPESIVRWMDKIPEKIRLMSINPYLEKTPAKEYFKYIYHNVAAGLISGSIDNMKILCDLFKTEWENIISEGWYQLDEAILAIIIRKNKNLIDMYYGDYQSIIVNYLLPVGDQGRIFSQLHKSRDHKDYFLVDHILSYVWNSYTLGSLAKNILKIAIKNDRLVNNGSLKLRTKKLVKKHNFGVEFDFNVIIDQIRKLRDSNEHELVCFCCYNILDWDLSEEQTFKVYELLGVSCFYTKRHKKGFEYQNLLCLKEPNTHNMRNLSFYINKLDCSFKKKFELSLETVEKKLFNPTNPSLVRYKKGWLLIFRLVNYEQNKGQNFRYLYNNHTVSKIGLLILDDNFNITSQSLITDHTSLKVFNKLYEGFEDPNVFIFKNKYYILANALDRTLEGYSQMFLLELDVENSTVTKGEQLYKTNQPEKNWLPIPGDNIRFLYSYNPVKVVENNNMVVKKKTSFNLSGLKGSGGLQRFIFENKNGFLAVVHESVWIGKDLNYYHRFVWFNEDLEICDISFPWYYDHKGVEFCRSMVVYEGWVYMGVGIEDGEAWVYKVAIEKVNRMLKSTQT